MNKLGRLSHGSGLLFAGAMWGCMTAYLMLGILTVAGSVAEAEDSNYYTPHTRWMDPEKVVGTSLSWEEVKKGQESGIISAVVPYPTQAFDSQSKTWIEIPKGAELVSIHERCTGWMNAFIQGSYGGRQNLYFREWDVHFHNKANGKEFSGLLEECGHPVLTPQRILLAQREGLVLAFTNKLATLHGESGALIYVGSHFRNRGDFTIEWMSRSTTGVLKIPANRQVTLENEPCRPFYQVKISYAGGTYWVRAFDLEMRMAGKILAETPLGSAAWHLCD